MKKEWERLEPIRIRIMSEAYDLADRGDSEGYNSVKVMCGDVLDLIKTEIATEREACAEVCENIAEEFAFEPHDPDPMYCAEAIRARGEQ